MVILSALLLLYKIAHMRPEPGDGVERRLLVLVDGAVVGGEVGVLEELPAVAAQPLDVLVVGLLQPPLQRAVHRPVPAITKCTIIEGVNEIG